MDRARLVFAKVGWARMSLKPVTVKLITVARNWRWLRLLDIQYSRVVQ
jgi:hypothetical protein